MHVAIIGGGLSGTLVCMQLLRRSEEVRITLIERRSRQLNRGVAYSARLSRQLLNVPASRMGIFPEDPEGFLRWARSGPLPGAGPNDFLPRSLFGDYVHDQFHDMVEHHSGRVTIERADAISLDHHPAHGYTVGLHNGHSIKADRVVLALGNAPPAHVPSSSAAAIAHRGYVGWPWKHGALDGIRSNDHILFVGAGLTMVDVLLSCIEQGHKGPVTVVSRRGLLPRPHAVPQPWVYSSAPPKAPGVTTAQLMRWVRQEVAGAALQNVPWQSVMDAVKPLVKGWWLALDRAERSRFLRHVRPYWEVHRHRMPREAHERLIEVQRSGQLKILAAGIGACDVYGERLLVQVQGRRGVEMQVLEVDHVINCTGPQADTRRMEQPLLKQMLAQGFASWDQLHLGLNTAPNGALIGRNGRPAEGLFAIGPLCKATLWECTAVPEIREQADVGRSVHSGGTKGISGPARHRSLDGSFGAGRRLIDQR